MFSAVYLTGRYPTYEVLLVVLEKGSRNLVTVCNWADNPTNFLE